MNLVIDQGNTFCKWAIFEAETMIIHDRLLNNNLDLLSLELVKYSIKGCIVSSVSDTTKLIKVLDGLSIETILLDKNFECPIKIKYTTPETLGQDRLIAAIGAHKISPATTNLIIDMGTCITYDICTINDGYIGGNIAPGLDMRLNAMHHFTKRLPLLERKETENDWGDSTSEAIVNGAQIGIKAEVEYYIDKAKEKYGNISVFLTGGDAYYFETKIKNGIFAYPNLLFSGLHEILKINLL